MMHHLYYGESYTTLLSAEENNNPFLVLMDVYGDAAAPEQLLDELFEIITVAIRKDYWLKYESPLVLYRYYKKIMRVLEAGWLIAKIRPHYTDMANAAIVYEETKPGNKTRRELDEVIDPLSYAYRIMLTTYQPEILSSYRVDLLEFLFEALSPTCVKYDSYIGECLLSTHQEIEELFKALFLIHRHELGLKLSENDRQILAAEFTKIKERQTLYEYESDISDVYHGTAKEEISIALKLVRNFSYENGFWRTHKHPANMLYYFHEFLFIIESFWQYHQFMKDEGEDINQHWKITDEEKAQIYQLTKKKIKKPGKYLDQQFQSKSLAEWRNLLENCLEAVLSNKKIDYEKTLVFKPVLEFLDVLLIFIDILKRSDY